MIMGDNISTAMLNTVLKDQNIDKEKELLFTGGKSNTEISGRDLAATFSADNTSVKYKFFHKVKFLRSLSRDDTRQERNQIITEFNDKLERAYDDHRTILVNEHRDPHLYFDPMKVADFPNKVVLPGLTKLAEIATNQSNTFFDYIEVGEGTIPVGPLNNRLTLPVYRVNIHDLGWDEPHGTTIRKGTLFPEDMQNCTVSEIGCFDRVEGGTMFWKVVIGDSAKYLDHTVNESYVTCSHVLTLKSR